MAIRTSEVEVRQIIDTGLSDIDIFITTASMFVDNYLADKTGLTDANLTLIERYLAAHFLSVQDPRVKAERIDIISQTYTNEYGKGLNGTAYGQTAVLLDHTGTLGQIANKGYRRSGTIQTISIV